MAWTCWGSWRINGWAICGLNAWGGGGQKVTVFHNWSSGKYLCRSLHNNGFRSFKFLISWPMTYYRNHRTTLYLILALRSPAWLVKLHYCCNEMHYSPLPVVFFFYFLSSLLFVKLTSTMLCYICTILLLAGATTVSVNCTALTLVKDGGLQKSSNQPTLHGFQHMECVCTVCS